MYQKFELIKVNKINKKIVKNHRLEVSLIQNVLRELETEFFLLNVILDVFWSRLSLHVEWDLVQGLDLINLCICFRFFHRITPHFPPQ